MPAKWTAEFIGEMHTEGVTRKQVAAEAGVTPEYISMILNGHREPKGAEEMMRGALKRLRDKR